LKFRLTTEHEVTDEITLSAVRTAQFSLTLAGPCQLNWCLLPASVHFVRTVTWTFFQSLLYKVLFTKIQILIIIRYSLLHGLFSNITLTC